MNIRRLVHRSRLSILCSLLLVPTLLAPTSAAGNADSRGRVTLKALGLSGQGAVVTLDEKGYRIHSIGTPQEWSDTLSAAPNFLQAGSEAGTVVVGHLRNDGSPRWAQVYSSGGDSWSPPGVVQQIHLSSRGDKVLAMVQVEGRDRALVLDAAGKQLAQYAIGVSEAHTISWSASADAVAVTPGPEGGPHTLTTYEIETGIEQRHELDPRIPVEDAVALDAHHLVILGSGSLTMVLMPNAEEFPDEGVFGWTLHDRGYSTLLGATDDGGRFLATRGQGRFDLIGRDGDVLWSFDPQSPGQEQRFGQVNLGRAHPFLHPDGQVELKDDAGTGRYLLTWPPTRGVLGSPTVRWEATE